MNPELAQKTLRFVQAANVLAKRSLDERNQLVEDRHKAGATQEQLISDMIGAETIGDHQVDKAAEMLGTHAGTTTLLKAAVAKIAEMSKGQKQAGDLGQGVDPAVVDSGEGESRINPNYVGQRTSEKKASDRAILAVLDAPG